ncbi:unnamed protein product [Cyberlindnera jadinii]|uniref:Uncharacterized protein n=1 Tax=Cyberlindnera jadinii (strain ATCC 18201 / CBS 1600 / BCRC 20928 / JCM 3617 / NBRC 0987 / NRRL Y-1542) TaxID=983966 RepID=A0A0H5CFW5_CYBJN|nr:unnamed protein product [Cyberlindnera jadinii]
MLSTRQFISITRESLFLQPPAPSLTAPGESQEAIVSRMAQIMESINNETTPYSSFIKVSQLAKHCIVSYDLESETVGLNDLFVLWEIHLTSLLFAQELSLAQQEAKRLSTAFDSLLKSQNIDQSTKTLLFPEQVPFSLKLLLIRLRAVGPSVTVLNDSYLLLWEVRQEFVKSTDLEYKEFLKKQITALSYGVGAALIAKREYATFLTMVEGIEHNTRMKLLATLISLMKGDWDLADEYFNQILDHLEQFSEELSTVIKTTNPVLDLNNPDTGIDNELKIEKLDDLLEKVKDQMITGRIVCSLCALFELQLREVDGKDSFQSQTKGDISNIMGKLFTIWTSKTSKLYTFE